MPLRQQDQVQEVLHALTDSGADWCLTSDGESDARRLTKQASVVTRLTLLDFGVIINGVALRCRGWLALKAAPIGGLLLAQRRPRTEQGERCLQKQDIDAGLTHGRASANQASALLIEVRTT